MDKRYTICLSIAFFIHALGIFSFHLPRMMAQIRARESRKMYGVEYREEKEKKKEEPKKEKKLLTPKKPTVSLKDKLKSLGKDKIPLDDMKKLAEIANPLRKTEKMVDISKMIGLHETQAAIDLGKFEQLDLSKAMGDVELIRLGAGISTSEILKEEAIALPTAAMSGQVGLFTTPGAGVAGSGGGIELETGKGSKLIETGAEEFKKEMERAAKARKEEKKKVGKEAGVAAKPEVKVEITGVLADRNKIDWPLPRYPEWAERQGLSGRLTLRLKVGPDGKITGTILIVNTTGYPDWDNGVIEWIKRHWRWEAVPGLSSPGFITFRFILG